MRFKALLLIILLLAFTACGKEEIQDSSAPVETEEPVDPPYIPTVYYYEVSHADTSICVTMDNGVSPYGEVIDYDAYMKLDPIAVFFDGDNFIYVGVTSCEDYSQYAQGTLYLSATSDEVLTEFKKSVITLSNEVNYSKLDMPELHVSDAVIDTRRQEQLTGYDNFDVASYAFVTLKDGTEGAVCYTWKGDYMEMVVVGLDSHVYSFRNDETELLVEDTGEVFELDFYANPNYDPYSNNE